LEEYLSSARPETPISNFENRLISLDGSVRWYHWSVRSIPNERGEIVEFQAVGQDITGRKLAEQELRLSEERFRSVFESASDNIFIKDLFLRYTHVNQAMEKLLGLPSSKIIGRTAEELFDLEVSAYIRNAEQRVLQGEVIEAEHTQNIRGISVTFSEIRVPLRNSSGDIVALCGISRDITDRRARESMPATAPETYPSKLMRETLNQARRAAETESVVLLFGEAGSGKDYLARFIHEHSKRGGGPFLSFNCAAVPTDLAESELFGHESGAFTVDHGRKRGLMELAEGGTLLLNEIGELSLPLQDKLLTFLDDRQFTRVGGEKKISVNARIVAATIRDLEKEVAEERFRQDLFYRINTTNLAVPPLRERAEDIPILAGEILSILTRDLALNHIPTINQSTMDSLIKYHWPGNVRELRNVLERGLMLWDAVSPEFPLPPLIPGQTEWSRRVTFPSAGLSLRDITDEITKALCEEALQRCKGNKKDAAQLLGIARDSLYRYMKEFEIESEIRAGG
jgi:two-component system response regulator AtoC